MVGLVEQVCVCRAYFVIVEKEELNDQTRQTQHWSSVSIKDFRRHCSTKSLDSLAGWYVYGTPRIFKDKFFVISCIIRYIKKLSAWFIRIHLLSTHAFPIIVVSCSSTKYEIKLISTCVSVQCLNSFRNYAILWPIPSLHQYK